MKKLIFVFFVLILPLFPLLDPEIYANEEPLYKQIDTKDAQVTTAENDTHSYFYFISISVAYMFYTVVRAEPVDGDEDCF